MNTDEWTVPDGFEMVPIYPDGVTAKPLEHHARCTAPDGEKIDFYVEDKVPALPLKRYGDMWHVGWDIPTRWAIDADNGCWMNDGHGGSMYPLEAPEHLVAAADTEEEQNDLRRLLGLEILPPAWHAQAIAEGWFPPPNADTSTGQRQRDLAVVVAAYAQTFSAGELRCAIRLGAPGALEGECVLCDTKLKCYCPKCGGNSPKSDGNS